MNYNNIEDMIKDLIIFVKENPGATVMAADDPQKLSIGYMAYIEKNGVEKFIHPLIHVTKYSNASDDMKKIMSNNEGRIRLATAIQNGNYLNDEIAKIAEDVIKTLAIS